MARQVLRQGAQVAICARDEAELERARRDLLRHGGTVLAIPCDVTDQNQVRTMVQAVLSHWRRVDVLINNAGTIQVGPAEHMTLEDYETAMRVHFWGPLYTTLAVLPDMRRRRQGRIVNISSIGGKVSVPHLLPYSASKFALVGFSAGLRAELAKDGIVVTTVCPGLMRTGSPHRAFFKGQHRAEHAWFKHAIDAKLLGLRVRLCPPEETIWSKAFIMERERYDGADIAHLLRACGARLDYPSERECIPATVLDLLLARLQSESPPAAGAGQLCQGTLLSKAQYVIDVEQWGYQDARLPLLHGEVFPSDG
jgi:NAD(P)-dependent dehydrogenase (short-subunit alcohol dehydrogenase family)